MQSDTVIGIVGAVVLVGVMVGVFAYEYNNAGEETEPTAEEMKAAQMMAFNETFADLDAMGDLDGDGVPNYNETDLDDDGTLDSQDDVFEYKVTADAGGSVSGLPSVSGYSHTFEVEKGIQHVMLSLSHAERLAADQNLAALDVRLSYPGGNPTATATVSGGVVTYTLDLSDVGPGTYTLNVSPFSVGGLVDIDPGTTVTGDIVFRYGPIPLNVDEA